jgi:hypothetical protein
LENEAWRCAIDWIEAEHSSYEDNKFAEEADDAKSTEEWNERIEMYLHRAKILGIENALGRQAVAKAATTCVAYLESMFRVYGYIPSPGFSSGEHRGDFNLEGEHTRLKGGE